MLACKWPMYLSQQENGGFERNNPPQWGSHGRCLKASPVLRQWKAEKFCLISFNPDYLEEGVRRKEVLMNGNEKELITASHWILQFWKLRHSEDKWQPDTISAKDGNQLYQHSPVFCPQPSQSLWNHCLQSLSLSKCKKCHLLEPTV